jgi:hypothetical protein
MRESRLVAKMDLNVNNTALASSLRENLEIKVLIVANPIEEKHIL